MFIHANKFGMDEQYHSKFRTNAKFSLIFFFSLLSHINLITPVCLTHSLNPSLSLSLSLKVISTHNDLRPTTDLAKRLPLLHPPNST